MYFRSVLDDTTDCNLIGIKRDFSFFDHELSHSVVYNFSEHSMSKLFETSNKITSKRSNRHLKIDNASFKITNRCLLIKTLKVFRIPSMMYNFSLIYLELVIARSDDVGYDVGAFPVGA